MLKGKGHLPTYRDGVVGVYRERDRRTDFKARRNPRTLDDMELVVGLCYSELSQREQDFEFAEQRGFTLSRKVKTHNHPGVTSECRAVIGNGIYDISHIDRTRSEMFLYLQSAGELEAMA